MMHGQKNINCAQICFCPYFRRLFSN